jgi:hypothetical protein
MAEKRQSAANKFGGPAAQHAAATGHHAEIAGDFEQAIANPQTPPIINRPGGSISQGPELQQVRAGDLITAQYVNNLVAAIQNLRTRVGDIEALIDEERSNQSRAVAS